jgi:hypothetical protein
MSGDSDHNQAPAHWIQDLADSDAEIARGESVPASVVHAEIKQALAELEAELAGNSTQ